MGEFRGYHKIENGKEVCFNIMYRKGRDYIVSCNIIQRTHGEGHTIEEYTPSDGFSVVLNSVTRKSKKNLQQAVDLLETKTQQYIDWFRVKENLLHEEEYNKLYGNT